MKFDFKGTAEKINKFLREVRAELRKVQFPSKIDLRNYTLIVGATVVFISLAIWVIDSVLSQVLGLIIK